MNRLGLAGRTLASIVFYVALPVALILGNTRWLVYSEWFYLRGFERFGIRQTTGMSTEQLETATRQIQSYFRDGTPITLQIDKEWGREPLFNERELHHLRDVRDLLNTLFGAQAIAVAYLPLYAALTYRWHRGRSIQSLGAEALNAGLITILLLAGAGMLAASNFDRVFVQFHELSFSNDLWMLDPRTDYMIRMFPEGFWFESAMQIAGMTVVESLVIAGVGFVLRTRLPRQAIAVPS